MCWNQYCFVCLRVVLSSFSHFLLGGLCLSLIFSVHVSPFVWTALLPSWTSLLPSWTSFLPSLSPVWPSLLPSLSPSWPFLLLSAASCLHSVFSCVVFLLFFSFASLFFFSAFSSSSAKISALVSTRALVFFPLSPPSSLVGNGAKNFDTILLL